MNKKEYHPNWTDVIRPSILKRDGYKCRSCGMRHKLRVYKDSRGKYVECDEFIETWAKKNGKKVFTLYLQVAHLDNDKTNNAPENLLSLCPRCHSIRDREHKALLRKIYRATPCTIGSKMPEVHSVDLSLFAQDLAVIIEQSTGAKPSPAAIIKIVSFIQKTFNYVITE